MYLVNTQKQAAISEFLWRMYSIRRELAESINRHQRENPRQSEWADGRRKPLGNQSYPHRILSVALRTKAQGLFTQAR